jgi:hypothetical protein
MKAILRSVPDIIQSLKPLHSLYQHCEDRYLYHLASITGLYFEPQKGEPPLPAAARFVGLQYLRAAGGWNRDQYSGGANPMRA